MQRQQIDEYKAYQEELLLTEESILLSSFAESQIVAAAHKKFRDENNKITPTNTQESLNKINAELQQIYGSDATAQETYHFVIGGRIYPSRRYALLIEKRKELVKKLKQEKDAAQKKADEDKWENDNKILNAILGFLKRKIAPYAKGVFEVGKKPIDMIDDVLNGIKRSLPFADSVVQVVIGVVSSVVHFIEAFKAALKFFSTLQQTAEKKIGYKTRLVTEFSKTIVGIAGVGVGAALIAGTYGVAFLGVGLMPVILPAMLFVIYGISLYNRSYIFHQTKAKLAQAEKSFDNQYENLTIKKRDKEAIEAEIKALKEGSKDQAKLAEKFTKLHEISKEIHESVKKLSTLKNSCDELAKKCITAERKVAYATTEVVTSVIVIVGTVLGAAAIMGAATVATLGILPTAIILTGVAIAFGVKLFEFIDEKMDYKLSNGIRNFFSSIFSKPKPPEKELVELKKPEKQQEIATPAVQCLLPKPNATLSSTAILARTPVTSPVSVPENPINQESGMVARSPVRSPTPRSSALAAHSFLAASTEKVRNQHSVSPHKSVSFGRTPE